MRTRTCSVASWRFGEVTKTGRGDARGEWFVVVRGALSRYVPHGRSSVPPTCGLTQAPFDELELGSTAFRARSLPPRLEPLSRVPAAWYDAAWDQLPHAALLVGGDGDARRANRLAEASLRLTGVAAAVDACVDRARATPDAASRAGLSTGRGGAAAATRRWYFGRRGGAAAAPRRWNF